MADPTFFHRASSFSVQDIAKLVQADIAGESNGALTLEDIAPLDKAGTEHLSFFDNIKYKDQFVSTTAGACLVKPDFVDIAPAGLTLLVTPEPYKAYAMSAQAFYPDVFPEAYISEKALIDDRADIHQSCHIEAGVIIKAGVKIDEGSWIESGAIIGTNVQIGKHCRIEPNAVVSHCIIGDHVRIYPGAKIGQDGFGFAIDPKGFVKVPQLGRVIIEDYVNIGAGTTIDRGSGPDTVIGMGTWIDNLVQIGHNVKVGKGCVMAAQVGISGSTVLEDYVVLGGQVGVSGHLRIGTGARIGGKSGVIQNVEPGAELMGYPTQPLKSFMRQTALLKRLIKNKKAV